MRPEYIYMELHPPGSDPNRPTVKGKPGEMSEDSKGFLFSVGLFILMCILI